MDRYNKNEHDIKYHVIWVTRFRDKLLNGSIAVRADELIKLGCEARNITILQGNIGRGHIHLLLSSHPNIAPSEIIKYLKTHLSELLQDEFPELKRRYWGQRLWARGYFCATAGDVTGDEIRNYIESEEKKDKFEIEHWV